MNRHAGRAIRVLRIAPGEEPGAIITVGDPPLLGNLQRAIGGGYLEHVGLQREVHAYVDEEGKLKGLPVNLLATALARMLGWRSDGDLLVGPVLFLGANYRTGEEADAPQYLLDTWADMTQVARSLPAGDG